MVFRADAGTSGQIADLNMLNGSKDILTIWLRRIVTPEPTESRPVRSGSAYWRNEPVNHFVTPFTCEAGLSRRGQRLQQRGFAIVPFSAGKIFTMGGFRA